MFDPRVRAADSDNHLERARGTDVGISFDVFGTVILVAVGTKAIEAQVFPERTPCGSSPIGVVYGYGASRIFSCLAFRLPPRCRVRHRAADRKRHDALRWVPTSEQQC